MKGSPKLTPPFQKCFLIGGEIVSEKKEQIVGKLVEVFYAYSDCIISRIEFMKENADLDNKTPFTTPFETFS